MRSLILVSLAVAVASAALVPKSVHPEPHRMDKNESVEHEISEALKDIEASRKIIRMTMTMNDSEKQEEDASESFLRGIGDVFSGMFNALQNSHVPFLGEHREPSSVVNETVKKTTEKTDEKTTQDLLSRTRTELKQDINAMRFYIDSVRMEFDEWMISNRHQNVKSMILGGLSAVFVLVAYFLICKCCRRRSRMNHLSAFVNEGFASRHGDTEGLLPTSTKKGHRFPSNSDEDI